MVMCRCLEVRRFDGDDAHLYATEHLLLIERGRSSNGVEDYVCTGTKTSWVLDFPLRDWNRNGGPPRLRRLPLADSEAPIGAFD